MMSHPLRLRVKKAPAMRGARDVRNKKGKVINKEKRKKRRREKKLKTKKKKKPPQ